MGLGVGWRQLPDYKDFFFQFNSSSRIRCGAEAGTGYSQLRLDSWCVCVCVIHCTHLFMFPCLKNQVGPSEGLAES